jgi:hypothetical protein
MYLLTVLASLKGVQTDRTERVEFIFLNENFEKILFKKMNSTQKKNFQARLLCAAQNSE